MHFLQTIQPLPILDSAFSLLAAFVLGTLIGIERQFRQRSAGLRTNTLVAIGAAAFVDIGQRLSGDADSVRVIANIVTGIGFLGAGVIMKEGLNIRGLNTAATLWCSAAVGAAAGTDLLAEAVLITVFVLASNTLLHPVVTWIERNPISEAATETRNEVQVMTDAASLPIVRRHLIRQLQAARYPVADIEIAEHRDGTVTIIALLVSTSVVAAEMDALMADLGRNPAITHATWESTTLE